MAGDELSPEQEATLALHAPDPMVATTLEGRVVWANLAAEERFALPGRGLVGSHVLDWIVPDDHEQAILAMGAAAEIGGDQLERQILVPAPYRLRHNDGTEQWYEIAGKLHPGTAGRPVMITSLRHITRQQRLTRAVELIAGGGGLEDVLRELLHGVDHDEPRRTGGISWIEDGRRRVIALDLPDEMVASAHPDDPWNRAITTGETVGAVRSDFRPVLAALAEQTLLVNCAAVPVADPAGNEPACFVLWADHEAVVDTMQQRAHRQVHSLLHLALSQRHERRQLRHAASHDSLTGLLNRGALLDALHRFEDRAVVVSLLYLDLDDFKPVNDAHGHEAGDVVLRIIAGRIAGAVRSDDLVSRVGGDEFAIATLGVQDGGELQAVAERLADVIGQPIAIDRGGVPLTTKVGVSIGVAVPDPAGPRSPDALLAAADAAMYSVKRSPERRTTLVRV
jgi:diguanylate cyclase (GGDEF)-like protein/PAS domain S-box-containing protein